MSASDQTPEPRPGGASQPARMDPPRAQGDPEIGHVGRFIGSRLWSVGFVMAVAGVVVIVLAVRSAYLAHHHGNSHTVLTSLFAGGILGIALISVGGAVRRRGVKWLEGDMTPARAVGRIVARRRSRPRRRSWF
jgi:hypothetical protein